MPPMPLGQEMVDTDDPCAMVKALQKVRIRLSAGEVRETVRIDGEEVTFQRANLADLKALIAEYEATCARNSGGGSRRRYAKRFRFG